MCYRMFLLIVLFSLPASAGDDDQTPIYQPKELATVAPLSFKKLGKNDSATTQPIIVAVIDSGMNPSLVGNTIVASKSVTGGNCENDVVGHGTSVAQFYNGLNVQFVCVQVLHSNDYDHPSVAGMSGWGTLSELLEGLAYVATLKVHIVDISLVGYQETPVLAAAIRKLQERAVVVMAAGNDSHRVTSPCRTAYDAAIRNGICVAGVNENGFISEVSSRGKEADVASYGRYTSWAAANTGRLATWLMSIFPPNAPLPLPALFKRIILLGAEYKYSLAGLVGDPDRGLDARLVDGAGAWRVLQRLQSLRLISSWPVEVHVGDEVRISINEDPQWLANFFPAFDPAAVPKFELEDGAGDSTVVDGRYYPWESQPLRFRALAPGDYMAQLIIEGLPVGDKLPIHIDW